MVKLVTHVGMSASCTSYSNTFSALNDPLKISSTKNVPMSDKTA